MQPNQPYQAPHPPEYGFIMDPAKPPRRGLPQLSGGSPMVKIAVILGGILVLLILFVIIRGIFSSGGGNTAAMITVAQDQQELVHLSTNALEQLGNQEAALSTANQNFTTTTQATMTSAQSQLLTYLKNNGIKVNAKVLTQSISTTTDQQLKSASTNSTYNSTYKQVMTDKLKDYQTDLQQAYKAAPGPKGRELLNQQYDGAGLLLQQLDAPSS